MRSPWSAPAYVLKKKNVTEFQDIRITELASGQAESGPLMNMVLNLSADAPVDCPDALCSGKRGINPHPR